MKKQESNNKNKSKNDFSSLNSELGSFDLEPPKRYREETKKPVQRKSGKKNNPPSSKETRIAQKKKRKRKKLIYKALSVIAVVIAIVAVITTLSLTVFFKIEKITVTGNVKYSEEQIIQVLPIKQDKNLFLSNTEEAKATLEEALPYVFNAEIKRKLPDQIIINITETPKYYSIKQAKSYILLDENLKVLELEAKEKPEGCVAIAKANVKSAVVGKQIVLDDEKVLDNLIKLTDAINRLKLDEITAISAVDVNTNSMIYEGRITIKLGTIDKLDDKLYSALTAIDTLNKSDPNEEGIITATNDKQIYFTEK